MAESAPDAEFTDPDEWPDPVLRERVARALSWHSDGRHRDDYQYHRGYWLGAADMALRASGLAEALADRDRARDVAVALEQEASVYGATSRAFGDDPDDDDDEDDPTIGRNPAGELDRIFAGAFTADRHAGFVQAISETEQRIPAYDSSGEPHPFEGTEEACARCGLIRAAPYHHGGPVVWMCTGASDCPVPADRHEEGCYATDDTDG